MESTPGQSSKTLDREQRGNGFQKTEKMEKTKETHGKMGTHTKGSEFTRAYVEGW